MLIDANIFLEIELDQSRAEECSVLIKRVFEGKIKAITTDFIIDTIIINMERNGCTGERIRRFLLSLLISKGLTIYCHNFVDRIIAIDHMKEFNLDFDDSLVVEAMHNNNVKKIVSFDPHFDKVEGIGRLKPSEII